MINTLDPEVRKLRKEVADLHWELDVARRKYRGLVKLNFGVAAVLAIVGLLLVTPK